MARRVCSDLIVCTGMLQSLVLLIYGADVARGHYRQLSQVLIPHSPDSEDILTVLLAAVTCTFSHGLKAKEMACHLGKRCTALQKVTCEISVTASASGGEKTSLIHKTQRPHSILLGIISVSLFERR